MRSYNQREVVPRCAGAGRELPVMIHSLLLHIHYDRGRKMTSFLPRSY